MNMESEQIEKRLYVDPMVQKIIDDGAEEALGHLLLTGGVGMDAVEGVRLGVEAGVQVDDAHRRA